jgi:hypothetical protein
MHPPEFLRSRWYKFQPQSFLPNDLQGASQKNKYRAGETLMLEVSRPRNLNQCWGRICWQNPDSVLLKRVINTRAKAKFRPRSGKVIYWPVHTVVVTNENKTNEAEKETQKKTVFLFKVFYKSIICVLSKIQYVCLSLLLSYFLDSFWWFWSEWGRDVWWGPMDPVHPKSEGLAQLSSGPSHLLSLETTFVLSSTCHSWCHVVACSW